MAAAVGSFIILTTLRPAITPASLVADLQASLKQAGTVTTALMTFYPRQDSAISFIFTRITALISSGEKILTGKPLILFTLMQGLEPLSTMSKGRNFLSYQMVQSVYLRPMSLLTSQSVRVGLTVAQFLAASPISRSSSVQATTEGVIRLPSSLGMISTCPILKMPTQEQVVPRSMPMTGHSTAGFSAAQTSNKSDTKRSI